MPKRASRAIARHTESDQQNFVAWWSTAMWILAVIYLFATFTAH